MTSIKVVDLNEAGKELRAAQRASAGQPCCPPAIEETNEAEEEQAPEITNEVVEETKEETKEEEPLIETPKEEEEKPQSTLPKPKPKPKASQLVRCPKCNREMTYKKLRYSHNCSTEPKPVKPQANPKGKAKLKPVKPPPEIYYSDEEEEQQTQPLSKSVRNQILKPQPLNPQTALSQHYQVLQQQLMKQKQEKMNSLCQNIFSSNAKRR
jgi:hypothetical protein